MGGASQQAQQVTVHLFGPGACPGELAEREAPPVALGPAPWVAVLAHLVDGRAQRLRRAGGGLGCVLLPRHVGVLLGDEEGRGAIDLHDVDGGTGRHRRGHVMLAGRGQQLVQPFARAADAVGRRGAEPGAAKLDHRAVEVAQRGGRGVCQCGRRAGGARPGLLRRRW
jgi:hypothetical protein